PQIQAIPPVDVAFMLTPEGVKNLKPEARDAAFMADSPKVVINGQDTEAFGKYPIGCEIPVSDRLLTAVLAGFQPFRDRQHPVADVRNVDGRLIHGLHFQDYLVVPRQCAVAPSEPRHQLRRQIRVRHRLYRTHDARDLIALEVQDRAVAVEARQAADERMA